MEHRDMPRHSTGENWLFGSSDSRTQELGYAGEASISVLPTRKKYEMHPQRI